MKKLVVSIVLGAAALIASPMQAQAATQREIVPFEADVLLCNGDVVHLSGPLLTLSHVTETPSGGFVDMFQANPQGVRGVDLTTGTTFHATGLTRDILITTPAGGSTETFVNRFHIQATGGNQSYIVTETFHVTITPDGNVTAFVDNFAATC